MPNAVSGQSINSEFGEFQVDKGFEALSGTALTILEQTEAVIVQQGLEKFSMRAVAANVGISLASLQYHYPTRRDLIDKFFAFKAYRYYVNLLNMAFKAHPDPQVAFDHVCDYMIRDSLNPTTKALYRQIWAMGTYDEAARVSMERQIDDYAKFISIMISRCRPDMPKEELRRRSLSVVSFLEGTSRIGHHLLSRGHVDKAAIAWLSETVKDLAGVTKSGRKSAR